MIREEFDFSKEYGVVLEGGGAKGAYQIGAWKALLECGVKIKAVAGVSVGALNGALMCMGDYDRAVEIWKNISYSRIMNVDDQQMEKLIRLKFKELSLQEVRRQSKRFLVDGGIDVTPLRQLIEENVDEQRIRESDIDFIMGTFNINTMKEEEISAKEAKDGYLKDYLMASASFPLFKSEKLNGVKYLDGGVVNNVPIDMLINRGYKDIIVIRIFGIGLEKRVKIPEDVHVTYIAPKINLCNVLEFNRKKAARNITLGYYDAMRVLKSLAGNTYYIEGRRPEKEYLMDLLNIHEEQVKGLMALNRLDNSASSSDMRRMTEEILPHLATMFRLKKGWSYEELYYAILEHCAKKLRLSKYRIYTETEFGRLIDDKIREYYNKEQMSDILMDLALSVLQNNLS